MRDLSLPPYGRSEYIHCRCGLLKYGQYLPLFADVYMTNALPNCRSCARQATVREAFRALFIAGRSMATSKAMMPITTNSSTSVNAARLRLLTAGNSTSVNPSFLRERCREVVILPPKFEATRIFGSVANFPTRKRNEQPQLYSRRIRLQDHFEEFWY